MRSVNILTPKLGNKISKKENYRIKSLKNKDVKFLSKILTYQMQQYLKRIIYHDEMVSIRII
jgi:hypothetical protein